MSSTKKELDRIQLTNTKINLVMPEKVYNQIQYLCREIAKEEWSGILFYKIEGSIQDIENFKIILEDILPLNKGTQAYTEYTFDERVIEHMEENEHLEECRMGHIHSHNTMGVFFSATDWSELEDNVVNHNYYLSLIVNNFMDFCAKVVYLAEAPVTDFVFTAKNEKGETYTHAAYPYSVTPKMIVYDCKIECPVSDISVQQSFTYKVKDIIEKAKKVFTPSKSIHTSERGGKTIALDNKTDWNLTKYEKSNLKKITFADEIEDSVEEFAMFVINTGNPIADFGTMGELVEYYESYKLKPSMLASNVISTYNKSYKTYYSLYESELNDPVMYEKALSEVILKLEHEALTSRKNIDFMLEPCIEVLKKLLKDFKKEIKA